MLAAEKGRSTDQAMSARQEQQVARQALDAKRARLAKATAAVHI